MSIKDYLTNIVETSERNISNELRTRYYSNDLRRAKTAVRNVINKNKFTIVSDNDEFNEIFIQQTNFHMMITLFKISPFETAVDIKTQTYSFIGMGKPKKIIMSFFNDLNKELNLKGLGMGR